MQEREIRAQVPKKPAGRWCIGEAARSTSKALALLNLCGLEGTECSGET